MQMELGTYLVAIMFVINADNFKGAFSSFHLQRSKIEAKTKQLFSIQAYCYFNFIANHNEQSRRNFKKALVSNFSELM